MKPFFLYLLRCADGRFYVGHIDDLEKRLAQHHAGTYPGWTSGRRPVTLVFSEQFSAREEAMEMERRVKGWSRAKKEALIAGNWAQVGALARGPDRVPVRPSTTGPAAGAGADGASGAYAQDERGVGAYAQDERGVGAYAQDERGGDERGR